MLRHSGALRRTHTPAPANPPDRQTPAEHLSPRTRCRTSSCWCCNLRQVALSPGAERRGRKADPAYGRTAPPLTNRDCLRPQPRVQWARLLRRARSRAGEHATSSRVDGSKPQKPDVLDHVVVDRFHASVHEVGFVPEARSARVPEELPPPCAVRFRARPGFERIEVTPLLGASRHAAAGAKQQGLVQQQPIGPGVDPPSRRSSGQSPPAS